MKTSKSTLFQKPFLLPCLPLLVLLFFVRNLQAQTKSAAEFIQEAQAADELSKATVLMREAAAQYPNDILILAYHGMYTGMLAGEYQDQDFNEAGRLVMEAFQILDKAVSMDSTHVQARLFRGTLRVNVPEFMGYLDFGILDLNTVLQFSKDTPQRVTQDELILTHQQLAVGYRIKGKSAEAISALKNIIDLAPQSPGARQAEIEIKQLNEEKSKGSEDAKTNDKSSSQNLSELFLKGNELIKSEQYHEAVAVFEEFIQQDSTNIDAYLSLVEALGHLAEKGYDDSIYEDQDVRIKLAFDVMKWLDKAVRVAPENTELRMIRGSVGVQMPFFVNTMEQSMEDLNAIVQSDPSESMKAEALYWLGLAHQRKAMTLWNRIATKYEDQPVFNDVLQSMKPRIQRLDLDNLNRPMVTIEFVLGFQDELPAQTAVWVEDEKGNYIKTIFVSGFSSHVKENQIVLSRWAEISNFQGVEGVTGASIDAGIYMYAWDLKNYYGEREKKGQYTIKVEVHYWPSMKYQLAKAEIHIGKKDNRVILEEGNYIPYLEINYLSN